MKWAKAPEELQVLLGNSLKGIDCTRRPMFGYPVYFINGNMFAGMFQASIFFRLAQVQREELGKKYPLITNLEPMTGRPMKEYFVLPEALYRNENALKKVAQSAADHTRSLPPKMKKRMKKPVKRKGA